MPTIRARAAHADSRTGSGNNLGLSPTGQRPPEAVPAEEKAMNDMTHLSILDGAFLYLETPEMPMHVGSLAILTPPPGGTAAMYEAVKAHVATRMHLVPAFTRKLAPMPFDLANPVWIADDDIDLDYHIRRTVLPAPDRKSTRLNSSHQKISYAVF